MKCIGFKYQILYILIVLNMQYVKFLNTVFQPYKIMIPKKAIPVPTSLGLYGLEKKVRPNENKVAEFIWKNPCFDVYIDSDTFKIRQNVQSSQIEFLKYFSSDYRRFHGNIPRNTYSMPYYPMNIDSYTNIRSDEYKDYYEDPDEEYLIAEIHEYPLRWAYMLKDFTDLPITIVPLDKPNKYIDTG